MVCNPVTWAQPEGGGDAGLVSALLIGAVAALGSVGWIGSERAIHKAQNPYT